MAVHQMLLSPGGKTPPGQELFTSTGSQTWTCPAGVEKVSVVCVGGGGGGGGHRPAYLG